MIVLLVVRDRDELTAHLFATFKGVFPLKFFSNDAILGGVESTLDA